MGYFGGISESFEVCLQYVFIYLFACLFFCLLPQNNLKCYIFSVIVRVRVVFRKTVVGD